MQKRYALIFVAACVLPSLQAQSTGKCAPKDMQGTWAAQPLGFFTAGPVAGPFAAVGTVNFDGVNRVVSW